MGQDPCLIEGPCPRIETRDGQERRTCDQDRSDPVQREDRVEVMVANPESEEPVGHQGSITLRNAEPIPEGLKLEGKVNSRLSMKTFAVAPKAIRSVML